MDTAAPLSRISRLAVAALLTVHVLLVAWGGCVHSPTLNEPGHLVAGLSYWELGRFDLYKVNPPLVRFIAAAPVVLAHPETDWRRFVDDLAARPEFDLGEDFVDANRERSIWLFTLARWGCIPFSVVGAYVCFRWARELYGTAAAFVGLTLWSASPNIIAHAQLITCDAAAASVGLSACYLFWHWLKEPTWWNATMSGIALGGAALTKTTLLIFYALWPLLWIVYRSGMSSEAKRPFIRELGMLSGGLVLVSVYVINLGYGFGGTGTGLGEYRFISAAFRGEPQPAQSPHSDASSLFAGSWVGALPVPLPKDYVTGLDVQKRVFESHEYPYLRGEFNPDGWWYHYMYALAVKVPLGTWALLGLAVVARYSARSHFRWRDELVVACPAMAIVTLASLQTSSGGQIRYVLPVLPFMFVWIGGAVAIMERRRVAFVGISGAALVWSVASSLWAYPHSLSYFNELAGGSRVGSSHLIHSNIDWGQDLLLLKRWRSDHPEAEPFKVAYFGGLDPRHLGLEYTEPDLSAFGARHGEGSEPIPPGWYAISVNFVQGFPYFTYKGEYSDRSLEQHALMRFQELEPVDMAGYSIRIYHVEGDADPAEHGRESSIEVVSDSASRAATW